MDKPVILSTISKLQDTLKPLGMRVYVIDEALRQWSDGLEITRDINELNVAIFAKEINEDLFVTLDENNIKVLESFGTTECGLKLTLDVTADKLNIDSPTASGKVNLYFVYESPNNKFFHVDWNGPVADTKNVYQMCVSTYERFRLKKVHLNSMSILVPKDVPGFLTSRYGNKYHVDSILNDPEASNVLFACPIKEN